MYVHSYSTKRSFQSTHMTLIEVQAHTRIRVITLIRYPACVSYATTGELRKTSDTQALAFVCRQLLCIDYDYQSISYLSIYLETCECLF